MQSFGQLTKVLFHNKKTKLIYEIMHMYKYMKIKNNIDITKK